LVISAEEDRVKPPKYSKIIAREIPNSTYVEVRESGHAVILEKPTVINYLLTGFIYSNRIKP
ncbi:MAG: alpha/beta hydrolase, partial [Sulfolobales archaeon]